jgi:hypothetical protein
MQRVLSNQIKKIKVAALSVTALGMLYGAACTVGDVRHNVVNGTLSSVKGYTSDLWEALIPPADQLVGE